MSLFTRLSQVFVAPEHKKKQIPQPKPVEQKQPQKKNRLQFESRPVQNVQPRVADDTMEREAAAKAKEIVLEAKDEALRIREQAENKAREIQSQYNKLQQEMNTKARDLDRQEAILSEKGRYLEKLEQSTKNESEQVEQLKKKLIEKLEEIGSLSREEARKQILEAVEKRSQKEMARLIKEAEDKAKDEAEDKAQDILVTAMQHAATDYVAEYTVSTVELPSEDIKGRLIGKEGRNIRAFEKASGVDLDLDESPGLVRLSSFDSVRREIAKQALKKLVKDGRIQPTRIEEYLDRAKKDVERIMYEEGKKLCHAVGAYSVPHDLIAYLGRFKFRTSYGQNMIAHTLEETKMGVALAHELKADADIVRLGCLFHDIGKVVPDEEGSHVELGVKLLKKYQMPQAVIDCVAQHHEDEPFSSNEAITVYIADAISGARPGARMENYEEYIKRLTTMETIAMSYSGVTEAYAIQAGRELRVIVNHRDLTDEATVVTAEKIRDRIKNEMTYPGTVTVNVIRELRSQAVAK